MKMRRLTTARRSASRSRGLKARFRWAALLLLLPLFALASVSAAALQANVSASTALSHAQQLTSDLNSLEGDVQYVGLSAVNVLVGHGSNGLADMAASERAVDADFRSIAAEPDLTTDETSELMAARAAWNATIAFRNAVRSVPDSVKVSPDTATALVAYLDEDLASLIGRLGIVEASGTASVSALQQQRDSATRASAIALGVALVLGVTIAAWSSRRLARSVLQPLHTLHQATTRLASTNSGSPVSTGGDEITELVEAFDAMAGQVRARERQLTALVENASDGICVVEPLGDIVFATPSFRDYVDSTGVNAARLDGLVHPEDLERFTSAWERGLAGHDGSTLEVEARLRHRDGSWRHVWAKLTNRVGDTAVAGMVINVSDVSERHRYEQQLTFQALHDGLTGLANRDLFRQRLERSAAASTAGSHINSVLYLDFDDFKSVNDTQGHHMGDAFLVAMAERIVATVRPQDTVARLGGDEYAILLEGTDSQDAVGATKRVLAALQQPLTLAGKELLPRASIGIATATSGTVGPDTLLADADLAMYFAKRQGKAQFRVFSSAMRVDLLDRLQLGEDLRTAIAADDIDVHYQPIVDMQTGAIVGAEALARWNHPTRGWVTPGEFIPLAEELNVAHLIDALVLRAACVQGRAWVDAGHPPMRMAVNLSGNDLDKPDLVATIARTLKETGFSPANLDLELTESVVIAESASVLATLQDLKALGLNLSIDDFGTGYSALSRLRSLPFDNLKVDKLFVDELAAASPGATLAETILDMARVLKLKVIAEGVESAVQAEYLRARGCEFAQGFLFSHPIAPSEFEALLSRGGSLRPPVASVA
jgi:diguanylate cyclase (GGDEF)-like protein/PAS domain S-box-containing protein